MNEVIFSKGYAIHRSEIGAVRGYVALHEAESITRSSAYAVAVTPSSLTAQTQYAVARHDGNVGGATGYVVLQTSYPPYADLLVDYSFAEAQFPTHISYGSSGGPGFSSNVFQTDSGQTVVTPEWDRIRSRFTVEFTNVPYATVQEVERFFYGMRGRGIGFRYKDWSDYQIVKQNIFVGDGRTTTFQLFKRYRSGPAFFDRIIRKPIARTLDELYVDDVKLTAFRDYYLNSATGEITFVEPPAAGKIGHIRYCEFDVPVRFDTDTLEVSSDDHDQYTIKSLNLIEILA